MKTLPGLVLMQTRSAAVTDGRFLKGRLPDQTDPAVVASSAFAGMARFSTSFLVFKESLIPRRLRILTIIIFLQK